MADLIWMRARVCMCVCVCVCVSAAVRFGRVPKREKAKILAAMQSVNARLAERALPSEFGDEAQLMNAVIRAHMETCDFTRDKVQVLMTAAHRQPDYTACPPTLVSSAIYDSFRQSPTGPLSLGARARAGPIRAPPSHPLSCLGVPQMATATFPLSPRTSAYYAPAPSRFNSARPGDLRKWLNQTNKL